MSTASHESVERVVVCHPRPVRMTVVRHMQDEHSPHHDLKPCLVDVARWSFFCFKDTLVLARGDVHLVFCGCALPITIRNSGEVAQLL